jgi:cbb3-type cytochrome oxidase subunit 1
VLVLPAGVILLALYGVMLYLARIFAITCVGQFLLRRPADSSSLAKPFVVGLLVYSLLTVVPFIGGLVTVVSVILGVGALVVAGRQRFTRSQEQDPGECAY